MILYIKPRVKGSMAEETTNVFDQIMKHSKVIKRMWIFIDDIDNTYEEFSDARNLVFVKNGYYPEDRFFVSTCVGSESIEIEDKIVVKLLIDPSLKSNQITYIDVPEMMPHTREYNVYFERAAVIEYDDRYEYYISGTASINKHGEILHLGDIKKQFFRIYTIIDVILQKYNIEISQLNTMNWYMRNKNEVQEIKEYITKLDLFTNDIDINFYEGKICRPEWLLETDCSIILYK